MFASRERLFAIAGLLAALFACIAAPTLALKARAEAAQELSDATEALSRLEAAQRRSGDKTAGPRRLEKAPGAAFLSAQTPGLAAAQLETYVADLALASHANLISSTVQPSDQAGSTDMIRIQANLDIDYEALQILLFKLETGAPYAFVDSLKLRLADAARHGAANKTTMNAVLSVKAIWRRSAT
jgi:general secretion pathway protein M